MLRKQLITSRRLGSSLISLIGSLFVTALILGTCIPLFLAAQRQAHGAGERARMREMARELTSRFREDVRGASQVAIEETGSALELRLAGGTARRIGAIRYRWTTEGLVREVTPLGDRAAERMRYAQPLAAVAFARKGSSVTARFRFAATRGFGFTLNTTATPRSEP